MADLVSRLLEAIAETGRLAEAARLTVPDDDLNPVSGTGEWEAYESRVRRMDSGEEVAGSVDCDYDGHPPLDAEVAEHIAHNDPSSVLRRCSADRKLVDLHGIVHRDIGWLEWDEGEHAEMYAELPVCGLCVPKHSSFPHREDVPEGACRTVRILAEGYGLAVHQEGGDRG